MKTAEIQVGTQVYHILSERNGEFYWAHCLETDTYTVSMKPEDALLRMHHNLLDRLEEDWHHPALRPLPRSWRWWQRWDRLRTLMDRYNPNRRQARAGA